MTIWRPHPGIRVKAIGLHWRGPRLLACEVRDDAGAIKGVRPLGGTVEFGETWQQALIREFGEELGIAVTVSGAPLVIENIYEHEGATGHEILFVAEVLFPDGAFAGRDVIAFAEDNGTECLARWFDIDALGTDTVDLYPTGLKTEILRRR